jgi:hypothetical protein
VASFGWKNCFWESDRGIREIRERESPERNTKEPKGELTADCADEGTKEVDWIWVRGSEVPLGGTANGMSGLVYIVFLYFTFLRGS